MTKIATFTNKDKAIKVLFTPGNGKLTKQSLNKSSIYFYDTKS